MYVVRLLPAGRKYQGSGAEDPTRFGNSKPCVRCLQALDAAGIRRVVYTTGSFAENGEVDCAMQVVAELLDRSAVDGGHCSRGDAAAGHASAAAGDERRHASPTSPASSP